MLPPGIALDWDKTSIETVNARRAQISLDGNWRFVPGKEELTGFLNPALPQAEMPQ